MKNLKQVITNALLAVFGVLVLGFGAGAYVAVAKEAATGYDLLDLFKDFVDANSKMPASLQMSTTYYNLYLAAIILTIIFACFIIVLAALNILTNLNVLKSEKLEKILNIANMVLTALLLLFLILTIVSVLKVYKDVPGVKLGYGLIINIVVSVLAIVASVLAFVFSRKKA